MKILHLPNSFLPWNTGGTETYTFGLAKALRKNGVESLFCIHQKNNIPSDPGNYEYEGFKVAVLPAIPEEGNRMSVYTREYNDLPGFSAILENEKPDMVHFHDLAGGSSLSHLKEVKKRNLPAILTYHSPGQSCLQRALRYGNKEICDGRLDLIRCVTCSFINRGLPGFISPIIANFGKSVPIQNNDSFLKRVLTVPKATQYFIDSFYESVKLFDKIHVHAYWVKDLFLINKIPHSKLFFARTAYPDIGKFKKKEPDIKIVDNDYGNHLEPKSFKENFTTINPLKIVFLGRCDFVKGIHILLEAVLLLPKDAPIEINFWGPGWDSLYGKNLKRKIKNDSRFKLPKLLPPDKVIDQLKSMDVMVIPSIWPETGPLSLLEGLSAGLPIIGSDIGGIPEWIKEGENGFLFPYGNAKILAEKIVLLLNNPHVLTKLKKNAHLTRTMKDLADELFILYSDLVLKNQN